MAYIEESNLRVEVSFSEWMNDYYLYYRFDFLFRGLPVINPAITKETTFVSARECVDDTFIPALKDALQGKSFVWYSLEPDIEVRFDTSDDYVDLTFILDVLNLKQADGAEFIYNSEGVGVAITISKAKLMTFIEDLEKEYQDFLKLKPKIT